MVLAFVAEMEREKIMDRTMTGRINKAKEGKVVSGRKAPYVWNWFYYEVEGKGGKKEVVKEVVLHEEQAPIRRWIAEQYADGVSGYGLANQLNEPTPPEEGSPAYALWQLLDELGVAWPPLGPGGKKWNERAIVRLVSDPRATGKHAKIFVYKQRKTKQPLEPIDLPDGTYPAIIGEELYERILERRQA